MLRTALGAHLVQGLESPPNFSVIIAGDGSKGDLAIGLHLLYMNHGVIVRTRRPGRVIEGLFAYLAGYLPASAPNGVIRVPGVGLVKEGRAVLAPGIITNWLDILAPRLNRSGVQFVDAPRVALDVGRGDLVVEEPDLQIDRTALQVLDRQRPMGSEPAQVKPGRYPLVGWALFTGDEDHMGPISTAAGIMAAARGLMNHSDLGPKGLIETLGRVFGRTKPVAIGSPYEGDLASKLLGVFST